ncbi:phosphatase PAP2 family protein [Polaribacter sp. M15]
MKRFLTSLLLFFGFSAIAQNPNPNSNHFQTAGYVFKTSFNTIPSDFAFLGKEFSDDWKKTGYYAAGILGLIATDKITTKFYHNHIEPNIDYKLPNITPHFLRNKKNRWINGENTYLTYPIMGIYLGSLLTNSERGQFAAANSFKAIAYSTLITQLTLKTILGRNRPNRPLDGEIIAPYTDDNWDFFNKRDGFLFGSPGGSSLPSLHTTAYFAIAKVIQMEFDNYWIPYSIMAITWLSEIKAHEHWVSDMVVGGILGTIIGRSIVKSSWRARGILPQKRQRSISLNYIPQVSSDFTGLRIIANIE